MSASVPQWMWYSLSRILPALLFVLSLATMGPLAWTAQAQANPNACTGTCINPVTITFNPSTTIDSVASRTEMISICESPAAGDSAKFNGTTITGLTYSGGCWTKTATYSLSIGSGNVLQAWGCSGLLAGNMGTCTSASLTITRKIIAVIDSGGPSLVNPNQDTLQTFYVHNYTGSTTIDTLTASCTGSGISTCHGPSIDTVPPGLHAVIVTYQTAATASSGAVQLKARWNGNADSAAVSIAVHYAPQLVVSTAYTNQEDQDESRCHSACYAMTAALSTVPYISRDVARSVTLVYNGDRVAARPILSADVTVGHGTTDTTYKVTQLQLTAFLHQSGAWQKIVFLNGDTTIYFKGDSVYGSTKPYRLSGVFDASGLANGSYPLRMTVVAVYQDSHRDTVTDSSHHVVIHNTRGSTIAHGWTILGQNGRFNPEDGGSENETIGRGDGSVIMYNNAQCFAWGCTWSAPPGANVANQLRFVSADSTFGGGIEVVYPDSSKEYYAPSGQIIRTIDRLNDTINYKYNSNNRLDSITDPWRLKPGGGHTAWLLTWTANGLRSIIEPDTDGTIGDSTSAQARVTHLVVDASGFLTAWIDPGGDTTKLGYDGLGRLNSVTDRNGNLTRYAYDSTTWKVDTIIYPATLIDTGTAGSPLPATISLRQAFHPYQTCALPTGRTSASTPAAPFRSNNVACANELSTAGHNYFVTLDPWGQLLQYDIPFGISSFYTRDANGFPTQFKSFSGKTDNYEYTGPFLTSSTPAGQNTTTYTYGPFGEVSTITVSGGPTQTFFINDSTYKRGHVDSVQVAGSNQMTYFTDHLGRDSALVDALGHTTVQFYDARTGNLDSVAATPSGRFTSKRFDGRGRTSTVTGSATAGQTTLTTTTYDMLNRATVVHDSFNRPTSYTYDSASHVVSVTDPNGRRYTTVYNALGLPTSQTDPTSRTTTTTYNKFELPAVVTNRRGQQITYGYDRIGRDTAVHRPAAFSGDADTLEIMQYSISGDLAVTHDMVSTDSSFYSDAFGWLDSTTTHIHGKSFRRYYHHDNLGRVDSVGLKTTATAFTPNNRHYFFNASSGLLDSLRLGGSSRALFGYDADRRRDTVTYPSSVMRVDSTTDTDQLVSSTWSGLTSALSRSYGYDPTGRINELDLNTVQLNDTVAFFTYDKLGELIGRQLGTWKSTVTTCPNHQFQGNGCHQGDTTKYSLLQQYALTFDSAQGLDTIKVGATDTIATFASGNGLMTAWKALSSGTGLTFGSDSDGNRMSTTSGSATTTYKWSADGLLRQIIGPTTRTYEYNAQGQLVHRAESGQPDQYYIWDSGQLLAIVDSSGNTRIAEFAYMPGGTDQPLARITGALAGAIHYYAQDALGNVFAEFHADTVDQLLTYEPWGTAAVGLSSGDTTQLRWKGLLYEGGVASLYYMRARWYDPTTRRFISPDPLGLSAGINQYAFAGGDPINGRDPSGMDCADPSVADCDPEGGSDGGSDQGGGDSGDANSTLPPPPPPPPSSCNYGNSTQSSPCGAPPSTSLFGPFQISQTLCGSIGIVQNCTTFGPDGMTNTNSIIVGNVVSGSNVTNFTLGPPTTLSLGISGGGLAGGLYVNGFYWGNGGSFGLPPSLSIPLGPKTGCITIQSPGRYYGYRYGCAGGLLDY